MSIFLTKDTSASPDIYSYGAHGVGGDGSDPVPLAASLDGGGTPVVESLSLYVWANDDTGTIDNYSNISVAISGSDTGITWELSLDGVTNWGSSISLSDMDVSVTYATTQIYARATTTNNGSVEINNYSAPVFYLSAFGNPV